MTFKKVSRLALLIIYTKNNATIQLIKIVSRNKTKASFLKES